MRCVWATSAVPSRPSAWPRVSGSLTAASSGVSRGAEGNTLQGENVRGRTDRIDPIASREYSMRFLIKRGGKVEDTVVEL